MREDSPFGDFLDNLAGYRNVDIILDRILLRSRELCLAEAGTIFLLEGEDLIFAYTHNDRLFPVENAYRHIYAGTRLPLSHDSLAGHCALTRKALNIPNVRRIPKIAPYSFNDAFDKKSGFRTVSMLMIPMLKRGGGLLGVMQLINAQGDTGRVRSFSPRMERLTGLLTKEAAQTLENSRDRQQSLRRLLRVLHLHDPSESGKHAERTAALAVLLYYQWAQKQGQDAEQMRRYADELHPAVLLHDLGKIGVRPELLGKPATLTETESVALAEHCRLGAELMADAGNELSELARDTALLHHQRWDQGGPDIPLCARLAAIADAFDALVRPRAHAAALALDDAAALIRNQAGQAFDPELAECLGEMQDVIEKIYQRFEEE
ncbi:MAG: GAF domain-containing protein [Deltaproteobacteria bacterium]|jgi:hypothetical protein|nr:GAF domain-containing protein [Deltaproteobacteria bacterium]